MWIVSNYIDEELSLAAETDSLGLDFNQSIEIVHAHNLQIEDSADILIVFKSQSSFLLIFVLYDRKLNHSFVIAIQLFLACDFGDLANLPQGDYYGQPIRILHCYDHFAINLIKSELRSLYAHNELVVSFVTGFEFELVEILVRIFLSDSEHILRQFI
jgi:hypothetical protein